MVQLVPRNVMTRLLMLASLVFQGCAVNRVDPAVAEARHKLIADNMDKLASGGKINRVRWSDDGTSVSYVRSDQRCRFDLVARRFMSVAQNDQDETQPDAAQSRPPMR